MSKVAYSALGKPGSFSRHSRYSRAIVPEVVPELEEEDASEKAYTLGYQDGVETARASFEEQLQTERAGRAAIELAFARLDEENQRLLRDRIVATVHALCEEAVLPLALDVEGLSKRVQAAVAMLQRKHDQRLVHIHPDDLALVKNSLSTEIELIADPSVERGGLRVETDDGGVEDGPQQWRRALAEVFASCEP